ncbi:MAG: NTP transferase domain-containing protein [Halobacteriovoraceae bacterium]|jgi:molybdenum cofactor cytidylyltransferase|nr:NTP transferase domain-containing protein [Halobacteriovoraceae bacterium]
MELTYTPVIILAAGKSSRMGQPKGLLKYHGQLWIEQQFNWIKANGFKRIILVLGYHNESFLQQIPWLNQSLNSWYIHENLEVKTLINKAPERGSFSSLQEAISPVLALNQSTGAFLLPIDVPCPSKKTWLQLCPKTSTSKPMANIPIFENKGGHPVYLNNLFLKKLSLIPTESEDARLDYQIDKLESQTRIHIDDNNILFNLNDKKAWEDFLKLTQPQR